MPHEDMTRIAPPGFRVGLSFNAAFTHDGQRLAVVTPRTVSIWDVPKRRKAIAFSVLKDPSHVAFSPDGQVLVVKNTFGEFVSLESRTGAVIARFTPDHRDEGSGLVFHDAAHIVDGSWRGEIRIRRSDRLVPRILWAEADTMVPDVMRAPSIGLVAAVRAKHNHPDFEAGGDRLLLSRNTTDLEFVELPARLRFTRDYAVSDHSKCIAVRAQRNINVLDIPSCRVVTSSKSTTGGTGGGLCWSPDGSHLVVAEDKGFSIRAAADLEKVGWLPSEYPADITFSPLETFVVLADWKDGRVLPWPGLFKGLRPH
jgi:WD40 repeat protein